MAGTTYFARANPTGQPAEVYLVANPAAILPGAFGDTAAPGGTFMENPRYRARRYRNPRGSLLDQRVGRMTLARLATTGVVAVFGGFIGRKLVNAIFPAPTTTTATGQLLDVAQQPLVKGAILIGAGLAVGMLAENAGANEAIAEGLALGPAFEGGRMWVDLLGVLPEGGGRGGPLFTGNRAESIPTSPRRTVIPATLKTP